jgi:hypothetical protein
MWSRRIPSAKAPDEEQEAELQRRPIDAAEAFVKAMESAMDSVLTLIAQPDRAALTGKTREPTANE